MITHEYARIHEFVGRAAELEQLRKAILQFEYRAVLITGKQGVGKTALANRVIEDSRSESTPLFGRFQEPYFVSAYRQPWSTVMALAAQALRIEIPPKTTTEELQQRLIADVSKRQLLIVVDNIELGEGELAAAFCRAWVAATPKSVLLMTSGEPFITDSRVFSLRLAGVRDYAQRGLLGERLFERFGDDLLRQVRPLDGIPLSLLYLRWLDPDTPAQLTEHVNGLSADALNRREAIENLVAKFTSTPAPFMALGLLRRLQFDESLLSFFWDCMGGGSSGAYVSMRNGLIESGLLIPVPDVRGTYRVNEDIHKQLYNILSRRIGELRVENIHFFAAEYFRRQYERRGAVDDLDAFVYHSLECREYAWVYTSLFETDVPQRLQRSGLSVQLRAIMDRLLNSKAIFSPTQWARIYLVTASACNDLSAFDDCLDYMRRALEMFSDGTTSGAVRRQIAYYSAVAYSNTGRSVECLRSYYEVIAATPGSADTQGCLALAYLGHELKYHDLALSRRYGTEALAMARELNDLPVLARALCSLAETEIFFNERLGAAEYLCEAFALCSNEDGTHDAREAGRILKNQGLLDLVNGDLDVAEARLKKAREYSDTVRDRRRVASGDLYHAIVLHRKGRTEEAIAELAESCRALDNLKDGRYLVPALMTLAVWISSSYDGQIASLANELREMGRPVFDAATRVATDDRFKLYAKFWHKHFRDTVVIPPQEGK